MCLQTSSHHCVFLFADIECQDCVGSFLVDQGQNDEKHDSLLDCQNCSAGTEFVNITTECSICGGGKYQETDNTVSAVCKLCPVGLYIDISAVDQCSSQNDAVARDPSQHASLESCKTCPKGYEINGTDRTQCIICGFSKYQDQNDVVKRALAGIVSSIFCLFFDHEVVDHLQDKVNGIPDNLSNVRDVALVC